jgi:hypothetical protein
VRIVLQFIDIDAIAIPGDAPDVGVKFGRLASTPDIKGKLLTSPPKQGRMTLDYHEENALPPSFHEST